jgi:F-type H+-transporting ATPase subunit b
MKHPAFRSFILAGILPASTALAAEGEAKAGLPQMDVSTYPSQLFWLFVCFTVLYVLLSRVSLPRVGETLERRSSQKNGDLKQAADRNDEAERVKTEYERSLTRARSTAAANVSAAERDISNNIADEQSKFADSARKRLASAEQGIAKAKADALNSLADISAEIAAEMVQKVAGVQVNKADAKKAVTSAMQEG